MANNNQITFEFIDQTNQTLTLTKVQLTAGQWQIAPTTTIVPAMTNTWIAQSTSTEEVMQGVVTYTLKNGDALTINWWFAPDGELDYNINPISGYKCQVTYQPGHIAEMTIMFIETSN